MAFLKSVYKGDNSLFPDVSRTISGKKDDEEVDSEKIFRHQMCSKARQLNHPIFLFLSRLSPAINRILSTKKDNIVYSPYSIFCLLSLLYTGLGAEAKEEIEKAKLGINPVMPGLFKAATNFFQPFNETIANVNVLYSSCGLFLASFRRSAQDAFKTRVFNEEFPNPGSANMNDFIKFKTAGRIQQIVKKMPKDTKFFGLTTYYLETDWEFPFQKSNSRKGYRFNLFKKERGRHKCEMMCEYDKSTLYGEHSKQGIKFFSCSLPLKEEEFTMLFIKTDGLERETFQKFGDLVLSSSPTIINEIRGEQSSRELDTLMIPKFTAEFMFDLKNVFPEVQVRSMFEKNSLDNVLAEGGENNPINQIFCKCRIQVDEKGAEASSNSMMGMINSSSFAQPSVRYQFVLDQPFYCFVLHSITNICLVSAIIERPLFKGKK